MAMKPKNTGAALRTQTASWQHDSADYAAGMDNSNHPSYKKNTQYDHNQHTGHSNDGRTVNYGRGPTRGNQDYDAGQGSHREPPARPVKDTGAARKSLSAGTFNAGGQDRTPGGTRPFAPSGDQNYNGNADRINFGRGPTKGNQQ